MRIVHLVAGAGGMYCGSCLHGNTLAAALRAEGEHALLVPLYTPIRTDEDDVSIDRVAFGGINVFLQQQSALFRYLPRVFDGLLSHPRLLRWVGGLNATVRPEKLGKLTVSVLRGEQGRQQKELQKLVQWLDDEARPDVVHLNNALLIGLARSINRRLGVPVVCTLSGEDVFLEKLPQPHASEARELLGQRCAEAGALVAMNHYYADFMADYASIQRHRIHVIPPGVSLAGYGTDRSRRPMREPVRVGFLARICPDKGLHQLVEAVGLLAKDEGVPCVELHAAGYLAEADRPYLAGVRRQVAARGLADRFRYHGELDRAAKIAFLRSLDVLSVPTVYRESKGLFVLEAWASGVPVVLPAHGALPELVEDTGGGLLCEPDNPRALAAALTEMIRDPDFAARCGRRGQQAVQERYNAKRMAQRTIDLYRSVVRGG